MKKIILSTFIVVALSGCKKENQQNENNTISADSITISESPEPEIAELSLKETTQEELSKSLAKNNDTLYVTNFFATWCDPCMSEIPHFKNKIQELKGKPAKFTFVNIYNKSAWNDEVPAFARESGLADHIVLLDDTKLDQSFFDNFKTWKGGAIPFTYLRRGNKTDEIEGSMTQDMLDSKINPFLQ